MKPSTPLSGSERVAVVGFGRSSQSIARFLMTCGVELLISEAREWQELGEAEQRMVREWAAGFEGGGHSKDFLMQADRIVVSPGVDGRHPALTAASDSGIEIVGELALAAPLFQAPVIAVTGTNGKTTVTELIGAMLRRAGKAVFVGGNIGTPVGEYLLAPHGYDAVVLEVSSFQLERCGAFAPEVALLLNISPDHLDRHATLEHYIDAKLNIFRGGGESQTAILNDDDELCRRYRGRAGRTTFTVFGTGCGCDAMITEGHVTLKASGVSYGLDGGRLASRSGAQNSAAALLAVQPFGLDATDIQATLMEYCPGAHRMQLVERLGGVSYVNDSKATNTGAVINGIRQAAAPVILIAGGRDKGDDFRLLREAVAARVKHLVAIGEAGGPLERALGDLVPVSRETTMEAAVARAASVAEPGDTVLLSPACASFDMFANYIDRGEQFIQAVRRQVGAEPTEAVA